jgi:regulator of sigma E protease
MCVIAALDWSALSWWAMVIPSVAVGLGAVIFVHELGHFLVAKACGVKCEKFFIGFDVGGYKISRQWGETEYGIGILPLGGYVKMLGQDDNPANIAEQVRQSEVHGNVADAKEITGPDGKTYLIDRRSYLAKSVPQRMAIISAGVVMNVIFAFVFAVIAYKLGVPYNPSIVSQTGPGSPAWQADIRPGDEVVQIADIENPTFTDLRGGVSLGDMESGIPFVIRRRDELIEKRLFPAQGAGLPRVGIAPPNSLRLTTPPAYRDTPAADADPHLEGGDEVVAVDGQPVADYAELASYLVQHQDRPMTLTVRRGGAPPKDDPFGKLTGGELVEVEIQPRPLKRLGLVMQIGKIAGVQQNSPAAGKIQAGDFIESIADAADSPGDAEPLGSRLTHDPMTLPDELRRMAEDGREVEIVVRRAATGAEGRQTTERLVIALRPVRWLEGAIGLAENDPVVATSLGVAYNVLSVVASVQPDSPGAKAGMRKGDIVTKAEFVFPQDLEEKPSIKSLAFSREDADKQANWPALIAALQEMPAGTKVKLTYLRGDQTRDATLAPDVAEGYFLPERGLSYEWTERIRTAGTWGEAVDRGWDETVSSLSMVYRFLGKLGRQVSITSLGGPITIAQAAGFSAAEGVGKLLVFLTMLSANLAVINFLPIPLLDGGHMVFLLWEGIRGKPAGEKFVVAMHTIGFVFIITLMVFVISLDLGLIERNL